MNVKHLNDRDLLAELIGPRAARKLYSGSLLPLFDEELPEVPEQRKLLVAKELVTRLMHEDIARDVVLGSPQNVRSFLQVCFFGRAHEAFMTLFLDAQNRLIEAEELFRGTLTQTSVYPREIVKRALRHNAAGVIFAHNHPSGVCEPSRADECLTQSLKQALALVDVKVLDHFIVAGTAVVSLAERGMV